LALGGKSKARNKEIDTRLSGKWLAWVLDSDDGLEGTVKGEKTQKNVGGGLT